LIYFIFCDIVILFQTTSYTPLVLGLLVPRLLLVGACDNEQVVFIYYSQF